MKETTKKHFLTSSDWQEIFQLLHKLIFGFLTFTYSGAYKHHTREPIRAIESNQDYLGNKAGTVRALLEFHQLKLEELRFVQTAVITISYSLRSSQSSLILLKAALSGGAAIGVFSWPTTEKAIWATKMFWNWSLFFSVFALISSAHQRLLRYLPQKADQDFNNEQFEVALNLFLKPKAARNGNKREVCRIMVWFWQCPTMLMSYSWVFFITGYALHLLSPVFDTSSAKTSKKVNRNCHKSSSVEMLTCYR